MKDKIKIIIAYSAMLWLLCGVVGAGIDNAYFQRKWPEQCNGRTDLSRAIGLGLFGGPIAMVAVFFHSGFAKHGWSLELIANPKCNHD